jgi:pimeloyl-ACP methyl ester carboxylesterase
VRAVADAFVALTTLTDEVAPGQAGIAGISYGAGPVLLAGLEPDIREQLGFIITLGGYYDLRSVVTFFTTGHYRQEETDAWRRLDVPPAAARVFTLSNLGLLEAPEDRRRIRAHLMDLAAGRSDAAPPADLAPDAQALVALLHNDDPARVPALIEALSPQIRTELAGLDPAAHDLGALRARVLLIHGRADTIIPYTESLALARHLKAVLPPDQVDLFLIDGFAHVDFRVGPQDVPELRRAAETLLGQRATP